MTFVTFANLVTFLISSGAAPRWPGVPPGGGRGDGDGAPVAALHDAAEGPAREGRLSSGLLRQYLR